MAGTWFIQVAAVPHGLHCRAHQQHCSTQHPILLQPFPISIPAVPPIVSTSQQSSQSHPHHMGHFPLAHTQASSQHGTGLPHIPGIWAPRSINPPRGPSSHRHSTPTPGGSSHHIQGPGGPIRQRDSIIQHRSSLHYSSNKQQIHTVQQQQPQDHYNSVSEQQQGPIQYSQAGPRPRPFSQAKDQFKGQGLRVRPQRREGTG